MPRTSASGGIADDTRICRSPNRSRIKVGTIGEIQAKIGKALVEQDAALLKPENKDRLLADIEAIYNRDHAVTVTLTPEDIALVKMLATHADDLPKAEVIAPR
jgi:hypothetical protein